jgi:hypothetical protein
MKIEGSVWSRVCGAWLVAPVLIATIVVGFTGCGKKEEGFQMPTAQHDQEQPPGAEDILTEMADFMESVDEFTFDAFVMYEVVQQNGQTLHFDLLHRVATHKPDRLYWMTVRDDGAVDQAWFSSGKFALLKRPDDIYGEIEGPSTVPELVDFLTFDYKLDVPFSDILSGDLREMLLNTPEPPWFVGEAWVENRWTYHIALTDEEVDYELWIQKEGDPVPLKMTITWRDEEDAPGHFARFRNWNMSPGLDASTFQFTPPADAERIEIVREVTTEGGE